MMQNWSALVRQARVRNLLLAARLKILAGEGTFAHPFVRPKKRRRRRRRRDVEQL